MKTPRHSLGNTRSARIGVATMLLGAVLSIAGLVSTTASHENGGNQSCPSGSVLIAKFNFDHTYQFDSPAGNEHVVTLTGASASGATWHSTLGVSGIIVKGGPNSVYTSITPPQLSGTFSNAGLPHVGNGNTPDVSNVQFCGPTAQPPTSTSTSSTTTSHPSSTTTTHPGSTTTTTTTPPTTTTTTYVGTTTSTPFNSTTSSTKAPTTTTTPPSSTSTTKAPTTTTTPPTTTSTSTTTSTTAPPVSSTSIASGPTTTAATTTTLAQSTTTKRVSGTTVLITTTTEAVIGSGTTVPVVTSTTLITPSTGSNLPFTGGQSTPLLIFGILFLAGGGALTFSSARRSRGARA